MDTTDFNSLGDLMKKFESVETSKKLMPTLPILVRLDGKGFSKFTKSLKSERPFHNGFSDLMIETTKFLANETNSITAFTGSDEISLLMYHPDITSESYYDGKIQKLCSVLAGMASAFFSKNLAKYVVEKSENIAYFDCRVWNVPNKHLAANNFLWREMDVTRNSISMLAQHYFSHSELEGVGNDKKQSMLITQHSVNWNDIEVRYKRGTYVQKVITTRAFSKDEIDALPLKHSARSNPDMVFIRSKYDVIDMPIFSTVINKVEVVFDMAKPEVLCVQG